MSYQTYKCSSCGKEFRTSTRGRKYCDDCSKYIWLIQIAKNFKNFDEKKYTNLIEMYKALRRFMLETLMKNNNPFYIIDTIGITTKKRSVGELYRLMGIDNTNIFICPWCGQKHDGMYGRGVFCSKSCSTRYYNELRKKGKTVQSKTTIEMKYDKKLQDDSDDDVSTIDIIGELIGYIKNKWSGVIPDKIDINSKPLDSATYEMFLMLKEL